MRQIQKSLFYWKLLATNSWQKCSISLDPQLIGAFPSISLKNDVSKKVIFEKNANLILKFAIQRSMIATL